MINSCVAEFIINNLYNGKVIAKEISGEDIIQSAINIFRRLQRSVLSTKYDILFS